MKRNRKVSRRRSVVGMHVRHFVAVMLMFAVMVVLNLLVSSSCGQLMKSIGEKDRLIKARQDELDSSKSIWRRTTSTDNLAIALHRRGIEMSSPQSDYVIHIDSHGNVDAKERSVVLVRERQRALATAAYSPTSGGMR